MTNLYIGDVDESEVLGWLIENIGPLALTTKADFNYYNTYHGADDKWIMDTSDVSDVSGQFDTITMVGFRYKEDAMLAKLRWAGSLG